MASRHPHTAVLLFSDDVGSLLKIGKRAARSWISSGRLGPPLRIGRRLAIRAADFESALPTFEIPTARPHGRRAFPDIDPKYAELLKPRPRRFGEAKAPSRRHDW